MNIRTPTPEVLLPLRIVRRPGIYRVRHDHRRQVAAAPPVDRPMKTTSTHEPATAPEVKTKPGEATINKYLAWTWFIENPPADLVRQRSRQVLTHHQQEAR